MKISVSELLIGKVLRLGVLISTAIVLLGGGLFLIQHASETHTNSIFIKTKTVFSFYSVIKGSLQFKPDSLIFFGLSILLLTQLIRVFLTACYFIEEKEKRYFWASLFVFFALVYSIWHGV
jgi:uncharacterized membrane protein